MNQTEFTFRLTELPVKQVDQVAEKRRKHAEKIRRYRAENPESYAAANRRCLAKNKDKYNASRRVAYAEKMSRPSIEVEKIKEKKSEASKDYWARNKEKRAQAIKAYKLKNKDKIAASAKNRRVKNILKARRYALEYYHRRKLEDPIFALTQRLRVTVSNSFKNKGYGKNSKTAKILGCSWETVKKHIEDQFIDGMKWERISEIHIDHIIPLASATTEQEVIALNHYKNLRPLWKTDNLRKSDKMPCGTSSRTLRRKAIFTPPSEDE
jgi:hypothetical protein